MCWAAYGSIDELVDSAEAIVVGTVTSAVAGHSTEEFVRMDDVRVGLPYTVASVQVQDAVAGATGEGGLVVVWQEGKRGMHPVTSTTFRLLEPGERYLLFLAPSGTDDTFRLVGGPQGAYRVVDNTVLPLEGDDHRDAPGLAGQPLDDATRSIRARITA